MTKLILTMAAGSALLLVSCEPIPVYPHQRPRPNPEQTLPEGQEQGVVQPPTRDQYPLAERTANPNHVISPYAPYNVINVEGFRSGQLAKDPSNQKIFRIP
jgi:hypothetical protein